jgi:hypothetical protein
MAPTIGFYAGTDFNVNDLAGSGLGFFGDSGFGASVQVGQWQGRTFITNGNGTVQGPECDNCKYLSSTGVILGQTGSGITLNKVPNYLSTLNVRFTNDTAVRTQNVQLRIYDRTTPSAPASGVTTAVAEIAHTDTAQTATGSGSSTWYMFPATGAPAMTLTASPGTSGLRPSGSSTTDTRHDWYLALSSSPDSIGSKTQYGLYVSLEFL